MKSPYGQVDVLGEAIVHPATLLLKSKMVGLDSVTDGGVPVTDFLILEDVDMDAAIEIARSDSFTAYGAIGVSEMMVMGG